MFKVTLESGILLSNKLLILMQISTAKDFQFNEKHKKQYFVEIKKLTTLI